MTATCEVEIWTGGLPDGRVLGACGEPAVAETTSGCVHEHIETLWVCEWHHVATRALFCVTCRKAGCYPCPRHTMARLT